MNRILIATRNQGKLLELKTALRSAHFELVGLDNFPSLPDARETGAEFRENAIIKAVYYSTQTGLPAIADDSGLEVNALSGRPGVLSARYAGPDASDVDRINKLLAELAGVPDGERTARFVCALAFADHDGTVLWEDSGVCDGRIVLAARGQNGFGYDPVFAPQGFDDTFGELPDAVKQQISHRALALAKLKGYFSSVGLLS